MKKLFRNPPRASLGYPRGMMGILSEFIGAGGLVIAGAKAFQASVFLAVGAISVPLGWYATANNDSFTGMVAFFLGLATVVYSALCVLKNPNPMDSSGRYIGGAAFIFGLIGSACSLKSLEV
ncbi:MAG: hypothetical protein ACTSX2_04420 [Candidatus Thorarchaeota archaeon]